MTHIIGYAYEADHHCPDCARERFGEAGLEHGADDNDGNPVAAMFEGEEVDAPMHCGSCGVFMPGHRLTDEGEAQVMHAFEHDNPMDNAAVVLQWAEEYDYLIEAMEDRGLPLDGIAGARRRSLIRVTITEIEECGCCGYWHPDDFHGDCRQDNMALMDCDEDEASHIDQEGNFYLSRAAHAERLAAERKEAEREEG